MHAARARVIARHLSLRLDTRSRHTLLRAVARAPAAGVACHTILNASHIRRDIIALIPAAGAPEMVKSNSDHHVFSLKRLRSSRCFHIVWFNAESADVNAVRLSRTEMQKRRLNRGELHRDFSGFKRAAVGTSRKICPPRARAGRRPVNQSGFAQRRDERQ
jgi:hypothetical protein